MYSEDLWNEWLEKENRNYRIVTIEGRERKQYLKKGYDHFDQKFWLPDRHAELQALISNEKAVAKRAFYPFQKILVKTPRFRYQDKENYGLETKIRPICFAAHLDSLIFSYYAFALTREYEKYIKQHAFDECVLAYRSDLGKCNIQFSKEVFDHIKSKGTCAAIALDIKGYFDHIDHELLLEKWQKILGERLPDDQYKIYKTLTRYSYVSKRGLLRHFNIDLDKVKEGLKKEKKAFNSILDLVPGETPAHKFHLLRDLNLLVKNNKPNETGRMIGIPQGSGMSALLSNIFLIDFDESMTKKSKEEGFLYKRYCDDILIVCDKDRAWELKDYTIGKIGKDYNLEIQNRKVDFIEFRENEKGKMRAFNLKKIAEESPEMLESSNEQRYYKNLQYLGFEFTGQKILIRSSSVSRFFRKMNARIVRTVIMAYSPTGKWDRLFKRKLLLRYSHIGKRNFLKYAYNASKSHYINKEGEKKEGLNSPAIKRQLARHYDILMKSLEEKNNQRFASKARKGKAKVKKQI